MDSGPKHLMSVLTRKLAPCLPHSLAFWHVGAEGKETKLTYSQLDLASQKAANVLARKGILLLAYFIYLMMGTAVMMMGTSENMLPAVLGIRDILLRIRFLEFVPLTNGSRSRSNSGSDSFL